MVYNNDNISSKEVTELVVRAKGILISNGYLLLANEDGTLQFPGGHLEENETL
ncbi:unknown [Clostridium sp. CAG:609]|nr:unknown [Clostridium sp. CAG:609]